MLGLRHPLLLPSHGHPWVLGLWFGAGTKTPAFLDLLLVARGSSWSPYPCEPMPTITLPHLPVSYRFWGTLAPECLGGLLKFVPKGTASLAPPYISPCPQVAPEMHSPW